MYYYWYVFNYNSKIDYSSLEVIAIRPMKKVRQHYNAYTRKNEAHGLSQVVSIGNTRELLNSLISRYRTYSIYLLTHIQWQDNCFQMTPFSAIKFIQKNVYHRLR